MEIDYLNVAELYFLKGNLDKSIAYNTKSLNLSLKLKSTKNIMLAYGSLAKSYQQKGNHQKAVELMELHSNWKDTLYNQQNATAIAEMETKYNSEKKEAENNFLKAEDLLNKAELEKKALQQLMLLSFIGLILLVVIYVIYSLIEKKKINKLLQTKNEEISLKNNIIEEKNNNITDSINYAQRIQKCYFTE